MQLSHTAVTMYHQCPAKYNNHYLKKIRSLSTSSPLFFGGALDEALNVLLLKKKKELTEEESEIINKDINKVMLDKMTNVRINSDIVDIRKSLQVNYFKSDFDETLLYKNNLEDISDFANTLEFDVNDLDGILAFMEECNDIRKAKKALPKDSQKLYNFITWNALVNKGYLLIEAFERDIWPEIVEVHSIQKKVHLPDDNGNNIIGYIDFEATFKDGVRRVMDNKTASAAYKDDSVETSPQLATYSEYMDNPECGYAVLIKKLRKKKEPRVRTQLIFGKIPESLLDETFEAVDKALTGIKDENFEQNRDSCFSYGQKCPYFDYCRSDGENISNLICLRRK